VIASSDLAVEVKGQKGRFTGWLPRQLFKSDTSRLEEFSENNC
jgi:hypothetical protein